jgi:ABC-type nickel/cobalt efflux system permease component RcnA
MLGLDNTIANLSGGGLAMTLVVAVLLGLRHATDPDHLTAVSTLVLSERRGSARGAVKLGLAWGLGHALTLLALGLPVVLIGRHLPDAFESAAEIAVGVLIAVLACRLLVRWSRGYFHAHPHSHGEVRHSHPHVHEHTPHTAVHSHEHADSLGRSPLAAFGIGLLHGAGGSAAVGVLIVGTSSTRAAGALALALFAAATSVSMASATALFGYAIERADLLRRLATAVPVFGAVSLSFGAWYALSAL